jgi:AraC-like DNA-binding protein
MFKDEFCHVSTSDALEGLEVINAQFTHTVFGKHTHAEYVISLVDRGIKQFNHKGQTHNALSGDISIISPDELHTGSKGNGEGWRYRAVYPSESQIRRIYYELFAREGLPTFKQSVIKDERLTQQMRMLLAKFESGAEYLDLEVHWELLLVKLIQKHAHKWNHPELLLNKAQTNIALARDYLADNYQQKVSLDDVAQQAGISKFHLIKEFKRCYQLTPHQYQIQQRLNHARAQIKTSANIVDVALRCGFHDQSHFSKTFVNAMGISPSAYRQQFFTR